MDRIAKMVERLPQFYRAWDRKSNFFQFLGGFSKALDEDQKLTFSIMRSHWIDTAYSFDLDLLGSLFRLSRRPRELDDSFRRRIKFFIPEFTGGGTRESIIAQTILYLDMRDQNPLLIENPPTEQVLKKTVKHGDKWRVYSYSINNEIPAIGITIEEGEYRLPGPMITDLDTQSSVKFDGVIESGQTLVIDENGKAFLGGIDVTDKLIKTGNIMMPRKGSSWTFHDSVTPIIGRFDDAAFDKNVYEMYIPTTNLEIKWNARLLASFELVVPENVLKSSGITQSELEQMVDFIKASGVKSFVKIVPSLEDYEDQLMAGIERGTQAREAIQELERQGEQHRKRPEEEQEWKIDEDQLHAGEGQARVDQAEPQERLLTQEEGQQDKEGKAEQPQPTKEQEQNQPESEANGRPQLQGVDKVEQAEQLLQPSDQEQLLTGRVQEEQHSETDNLNNKHDEQSELMKNGKELRTKGQPEQEQHRRGKEEKEPEQEQEQKNEKKGA